MEKRNVQMRFSCYAIYSNDTTCGGWFFVKENYNELRRHAANTYIIIFLSE